MDPSVKTTLLGTGTLIVGVLISEALSWSRRRQSLRSEKKSIRHNLIGLYFEMRTNLNLVRSLRSYQRRPDPKQWTEMTQSAMLAGARTQYHNLDQSLVYEIEEAYSAIQAIEHDACTGIAAGCPDWNERCNLAAGSLDNGMKGVRVAVNNMGANIQEWHV